MEPKPRTTWLTLGYQVPAEPSRNRVYVWRKLREYGAVYFRPGVALLPKNKQSLALFHKLAQKVNGFGGEATLAELTFLKQEDEDKTIAQFTSRSQEEYEKLLIEISSLQKKTSKPVENTDIRRLTREFRQIRSRDYFMSSKLPEISRGFGELLADMSHATDDLSRHVSKLLRDKF